MKSVSTPDGFEAAERAVEIGCIKSSIQTKKVRRLLPLMCKANLTFSLIQKLVFKSNLCFVCFDFVCEILFGKRKTCLQLGLAGLANQNKVLFSQPIVAVDVAVELNSSVKRLLEFSRAFRRLQGFNSGPDWLTVILTRVVIGLLRTPFGFGFTAVIIICLFSLQSCDFYFDNPKEANERGFNFEPLKVRAL